ncbi:MAG: M50 family metallopeptidase [Nanoarchaeota archaeon]
MKSNHIILLAVILVAYLLLDIMIPGGEFILYPIKLFVTFLHEFGHAFGAVITGGSVESLQVNSDGSGVTWTAGGSRSITIMGGYIGSALFGNLLLYLGIRKPESTKITMIVIAIIMVICSLIWFSSIFNLVFILIFAAALFILSIKENISRYVLMFLGGAAVMHIISDFNVGPSSDLNAYAEVMGLTQVIWMYIWLGIVVAITYLNLKVIIKR